MHLHKKKLNNKNFEVLDKTKLLGTDITNDLKWEENAALIVEKANTNTGARKYLNFFCEKYS